MLLNKHTWKSILLLWLFLLLLLIHNYPSYVSSWLISKGEEAGNQNNVVAESPYDLMGMANLSSHSC